MSTLTSPAPKVKASRPVEARLTISINSTDYDVQAIPPGEDGTRAWRLEKHAGDAAVYDVIRTHAGLVECDCSDYEARHRGLDCGMCKHGRALVLVGLLDAPRPELEPLPPRRVGPVEPDPAPAPARRTLRVQSDGADRTLAGRGWTPQADGSWAKEVAEPAACCSPEGPAPCATCLGPVASAAPAEGDGACPECGAVHADEGDPASWPASTDGDIYGVGPAEPGRATLAAWVATQAARYRLLESSAGDLVATTLDELARSIRFHGARTAREYALAVASARAEDDDCEPSSPDGPVD